MHQLTETNSGLETGLVNRSLACRSAPPQTTSMKSRPNAHRHERPLASTPRVQCPLHTPRGTFRLSARRRRADPRRVVPRGHPRAACPTRAKLGELFEASCASVPPERKASMLNTVGARTAKLWEATAEVSSKSHSTHVFNEKQIMSKFKAS